MDAALLARLERILAAGIELVPDLNITTHYVFTRDGFAALVEKRDGAFGNVRRIQQENFGNRVIASDLANPDFVKFGESFGAEAERARTPQELREALERAFARRDTPTLIEVPVGSFPSPWPFLQMPPNRGGPAKPHK